MQISQDIDSLVRNALHEDLAARGDVTSAAIAVGDRMARARIVTKEPGVIAGLDVTEYVFKCVEPRVVTQSVVEDGAYVGHGEPVLTLAGPASGILSAERTALNFLQRLSGIATLTSKFVERINETGSKILDTRKTTPGLRVLEKYAVTVGGGNNHRMGLFDMILIKENHIRAAGGISNAIIKARKHRQEHGLDLKIEVETRNLTEFKQALQLQPDRIMLDNMNVADIREAVRQAGGRVELEVSGGIRLDNVREYAETGVDFISVGALTHSARALDLSLLIESS